jgi:hypothetical protein
MDAFVKLVAAGPLFFVSAWLLMIFARIVGADVGIEPFGYVTSMVVTIALWLTLAPGHRRGRTGAGEEAVLNGGPVRAATVIIAAVLSLTAAGCGSATSRPDTQVPSPSPGRVSASLTQAFRQLFAARFPIRQMRVVDDFGGDDERVHAGRQHLRVQLPAGARHRCVGAARMRPGRRHQPAGEPGDP